MAEKYMSEQFVLYSKTEDGVGKITLNRPDLHNAFNEVFIAQFIAVLKNLRSDLDLKVVTLEALGKSFCAGADLNWMKKMSDYSFEENLEDSEQLAELFHQLNSCPVPVVLKLHGHALGGGAGLVACADEVIAADTAELGFTEVRLGLAPAVISPFVIAKIGESHARSTFLSGRRIKSDEAQRMGLVHQVVSAAELEEVFLRRLEDYKASAPKAQRAAKELIKQIVLLPQHEKRRFTTELISNLRISEEGQSGMKSLLNKTKPFWVRG